MANPPVAPYCDPQDIYQLRILMDDPSLPDFRPDGSPPKSKVDGLINIVASRIDQAYASVGYYIPFEEISSSSDPWSSSQTVFLSYFNSIGVAAMLGGNVSTPRISGPADRREGGGNWFQEEWRSLIGDIIGIGERRENILGLLRARARAGSPASDMLSRKYPILSDALEGYRDPTKSDLMRDFTNRYREYFAYNKSLQSGIYEDATTPEWMSYWHYRMGLTYEG
jgi:hypothetical protein